MKVAAAEGVRLPERNREKYRIESLARGLRVMGLFSLADAIGETIQLGVLSGDRVLHLVRLRDAELVTANSRVGSTLTAVDASMGKVLFAYLKPRQLDARLRTCADVSPRLGHRERVRS